MVVGWGVGNWKLLTLGTPYQMRILQIYYCKDMNLKLEKDKAPYDDQHAYCELCKELISIRNKIEENFGPLNNQNSIVINFNTDNAVVTEFNEIKKVVRINLPIYELSPQNDDASY